MRHRFSLSIVIPGLILAGAAGVAALELRPIDGSDLLQEAAQLQLSLTLPPGSAPLVLAGFHGREAISTLYTFELDLASPDGSPVFMEALLGREVGVTLALPGGQTRHFHGICSRVSQAGRSYRAEVVPWLWLLTRKTQSRVFQEMSVPDIVSRVLGEVPGLVFESRLAGTFHPRNYVVQYRESDFDFISRLMEEDGIFYFFRHTAGGHTMVLADSPEAHPDLPGAFPFRPLALLPDRPGSVRAWDKVQEIRPGKVTLRDHTFQLPDQSLEASAVIQETVAAGQVTHHLTAGGGASLEIYDYPGDYAKRFDGVDGGGASRPEELQKILPDGLRTAGIRIQEQAAGALTIRGTSTAAVFMPGHRFVLTRHVDGDGPYVLTSVTHAARAAWGGSAGSYTNRFQCIPDALPFRPARTKPRPVIAGPQTAVVVGPPGQEVFTDPYGRVKVQFHWDREGRQDATSSCWVRVATPHGGAAPVIPQVGDEVVVAFLEGDPDRPIIVGSLHNPAPR